VRGAFYEVSDLEQTKRFKVEHIIIGILSLVVVALIVFYAMVVQRNSVLGQELNTAHEVIHRVLLVHEALEDELEALRAATEEPQSKEPQPDEPTAAICHRVIEHILDIAPGRIRELFNEDVAFNPPEEFILLPNNRILINGQWVCSHSEMIYTLEAIFSFWEWNNEIWVELLSYSPFGWGDWRTPWESPNIHSWVRYHELETVPVRFHWMGGDWDDVGYDVRYLNGENFTEELVYHAQKYLNRIITDAWFVGRILYVNLHHSEPMRMSSGTFGEFVMYYTLVSSMASVPGIDALVIMVDGQRESIFGGHGAAFSDIYLVGN